MLLQSKIMSINLVPWKCIYLVLRFFRTELKSFSIKVLTTYCRSIELELPLNTIKTHVAHYLIFPLIMIHSPVQKESFLSIPFIDFAGFRLPATFNFEFMTIKNCSHTFADHKLTQ